MSELQRIWSIVNGEWGIERDWLGTYFVIESKTSAKKKTHKGYSSTQIYAILTADEKKDEKSSAHGKIKRFTSLLKETFKYDFEKKVGHEGFEFHYKQAAYDIALHAPSKTTDVFKVTPDKTLAKSFDGLYLGIAKTDVTSEASSFLMKIDRAGRVQLASRRRHYRRGIIAYSPFTVYFILNTLSNDQPELYITSVNKQFREKIYDVESFKISGTWINKIGKPVYGASLLSKKNTVEIDILKPYLPPHATIEDIADDFFNELERTEEFKNLNRDLDETDLRLHYLPSGTNVTYR